MNRKILKILFACFAFVLIISITVLPSFAYTSVNGWYDLAPNMPDMQMFYKRYGISGYTYPRTLTGYVSYTGTGVASQSDNGRTMRTFKSVDELGYAFHSFYATEFFLDFNYLPFSSQPNSSEGLFSVELEATFTTNANDFSADNTLAVRVGYYNDSNAISSKTFYYDFGQDIVRTLNLYDILNDNTVYGLAYLQIGFDFSGQQYAEEKTFDGFIRISSFYDWVSADPFVNASQNLYDDAYQKGYLKAVDELSGATAEDAYLRGYENGYGAGRLDGYNEGFNQATNDNANVNYQNGYQAGYSAGYNFFASVISDRLAEKYQEGYTAGHDAGYAEGEQLGYDLGYSDGYDRGYDSGFADDADRIYQEGYDAGLEVNTDQAFADGYTSGYDEGYTTGEDVGYIDGYEVGISSSIEEIGMFNFVVRSVGSVLNIPLGEHFTLGGILAIVIAIPLLALMLKLFSGGD